MRKISYRIIISLILIFSVSIIYLSTVGVKTEKFNDLIVLKVKEIDPNLGLKINKVSVKLDPFSFVINLKTLGTDLIYKNKIIELENIRSQISLRSVINNQFALSEIMISTKSIPLKSLVSLIRAIKNDQKFLIAEQFIKSGYIITDLKFEFNKNGNIKKNFKINGLVNNTQLSFINNKISKLNFVFQITDKELNFENIGFLINSKSVKIPELKAKKQKNKFFVTGKAKNKNLNFEKIEVTKLIDNEFLDNNFKNISFNSDSNFSTWSKERFFFYF